MTRGNLVLVLVLVALAVPGTLLILQRITTRSSEESHHDSVAGEADAALPAGELARPSVPLARPRAPRFEPRFAEQVELSGGGRDERRLAPEELAVDTLVRVVDHEGEPVGGFGMTVQALHEFDGGWVWGPALGIATAHRGRGEFEIGGSTRSPRLRVTTFRIGWKSQGWVEFTPRTEVIKTVLEPPGSIEGRLWIPAGLPAERLTVVLASEGRRHTSTVSPDGSFVFGLVPGAWTLAIQLEGHAKPLARFEDLRIDPASNHDALRRAPIDLMDLCYFRLRVVDEEGRPLSGARVRARSLGGRWRDVPRSGPFVQAIGTTRPDELSISFPARATRHVPGFLGERVVTLFPATEPGVVEEDIRDY